MRWTWRVVPPLLLLSIGTPVLGDPDPAYSEAFGRLYTTARLGDLVKLWCDERAPATQAETAAALATWKRQHRLDEVEARAETVLGSRRATVEAEVAARRKGVFGALDAESRDPVADCRAMLAYLDASANPQHLHPDAYRLVTEAHGRPATLPADAVPAPSTEMPMERNQQALPPADVGQAAHRAGVGVSMAQIDGIYQPAALRYNPLTMLFEPDETTYLLLKDGWMYKGLEVSPHDLDVAESRRREPQRWQRWRRTGETIEVQRVDEHGRGDGRWSPLKLVVRNPIGNRRLSGAYSSTSSATAGLAGGGGAVSVGTSTFTFRPNGSFSWANFTRGYASSSTGTDGGGIVAGGAMTGPGGTSVSSVGGSEDEGTYTIDGYTLELRTRKGEVHRFPIFSWDSGKYREYLVINGTSYSPPK